MCTTAHANELKLTDASCTCNDAHVHAVDHDAAPTDTGDLTTENYAVTGMTCGHCVTAVTEELGRLSGVQNVNVDLVAGGVSTVTVSSAAALDPDAVAAAVDEAGYQLAPASR